MTASLRRGGSAVAFTWSKDVDPSDSSFADLLAGHRFRSIERAASEDVSVGWVTPGDPTGESFDLDDLAAGSHWRLRFRQDAKRFPASKLAMEVANTERSRGRGLSARERRELKDDLHERLLPGILPRTQFVDVLVHQDQGSAVLLSSSKAAREAFGKLCRDSFGFEPHRLTSGELAAEILTLEQVGKMQPTRFPGGGPRQLELAMSADFLGTEFLLWLWWRWETAGGEFHLDGGGTAGIAIDDRVEFAAGADETSLVLRHGLTTRATEARAALRAGRVPTRVRMLVAEGAHQWTVTLDGASLVMAGVRLPEDSEECESAEDRTGDRAANWLGLHEILAELFSQFVEARTSAWDETSKEIAGWMRGGSA